MALIYKDNVLRNLQEQVEKNKDDILYILEEEGVLNEFGIKVIGKEDSADSLPDPSTYTGDFGDAYVIGTEPPYTFYIFTRAGGTHVDNYWLDIGQFPKQGPQGEQGLVGPVGPQGPQGETGAAGTDGVTIVSSNTMYARSTSGQQVPITGWTLSIPDLVQGQFIWCRTTVNYSDGTSTRTYAISYVPRNGAQGEQGEPGTSAESFTIVGKVDNVNQLPTPTEEIRHDAYLVPTESGDAYDMYVIVGEVGGPLSWTSAGWVEEVEGPQGKPGFGNYLYDGAIYSSTTSIDPLQVVKYSDRELQMNDIVMSTYASTFGAVAILRSKNTNGNWLVDYIGLLPSERSSSGQFSISASSFQYDSNTSMYRALVSIPSLTDYGQSVILTPYEIKDANIISDWQLFYSSVRATGSIYLYCRKSPSSANSATATINYTVIDTQNDTDGAVYIQNIQKAPDTYTTMFGKGYVITPDHWIEMTSEDGSTIWWGQTGSSFSAYRGGTNFICPLTEHDALILEKAGAYYINVNGYIYVREKPTEDFNYIISTMGGTQVGNTGDAQANNILQTGFTSPKKELPTVTTTDAGKFLRVSAEGAWTAETIPQAEGESV